MRRTSRTSAATKTLGALAVLCLALAVLSGCGGGANDQTASTVSSGQAVDFSADTVVITVDDQPVYWPEFKFWLKQVTDYYKTSHNLDKITDWSVEQDGVSLEKSLVALAAGQAVKARAIEAEAARRGIELSESDLADIAAERGKNISIYGSETEYLRVIDEMYYSEAVYTYLQKMDRLTLDLFAALYGRNGEKCTDSDVAAYVAEKGFMCAKYIFRSDTGSDGKTLSDQDKTKNRSLLEDVIGQLKQSSDSATLFGTLVSQYNQDSRESGYPDGMLFVPGSMGAEFEKACSSLMEGEYSDVVDTDAGLYVIMRMPIHPDMAADSSGSTLRYHTAYDYQFQNQLDGWCASMNVKHKDVYDQIRVEGLFE